MGETPINASSSPNLSIDNFYPAANRGAAANHRSDRNPVAGDGPGNYLYLDGHVVSLPKWPGRAEFEIK
jgi:prepilin-type processing-associated H-X9-DG protein